MLKKLILCLFVLLLPVSALADVVISEVCALNGTYKNEHAYDWIELHNSGDKTVTLTGWHLSDSKKNPDKWTFPEGAKLKAGKYLTVWCTGEAGLDPGKGSEFCADFAISSSGENLVLSDPEGNLVQLRSEEHTSEL